MVTSPETFPFIVVGNKTDLDDARAISKESAD
jgi:GTPase SAR1 family protein